MNWLNLSRSIVCILLITVVGCKKEESGPSPAPAAPAAAPVATPPPVVRTGPVTADEFVGQWKCVKVESASNPDMPTDPALLREKVDIRPDGTFSWFNPSSGRMHGKWEQNGSAINWKEDNSILLGTLILERPRLVRRDPPWTNYYEKQGPVSTDMSPKFRMSTGEFMREVDKDRAAAVKKYDGVFVELSGVVIDIGRPDPHVRVADMPPAGSKLSELAGIECTTLDAEPWAMLGTMQPVKVIGLASILPRRTQISEAKFALDGPSILTALSADDLAAEFATDSPSAKKKYASSTGHKLIITGVLVAKQVDRDKPYWLEVGKAAAPIHCDFGSNSSLIEDGLTPLQIGQAVKFSAELDPSSDTPVKLVNCMLITR